MFGAGAKNWQFTRSSGHGAALSLSVVRIGLPRMMPCSPIALISRATVAAGDVEALPLQLPPDRAHAIDLEVLIEHPAYLNLQADIAAGSDRQAMHVQTLDYVLELG